MSAIAETPKLAVLAKALYQPLQSRTAEDREFLPAALEIIETPPSPIRMHFLLAICAIVASTIIWMFVGQIDVIAIAPGKVQSTGRVKLVQPLETGRVREILVANGSKVEAGQAVILLDDGEARAEEQSLADSLAASQTEAVRRDAAIKAAHERNFAPSPIWPSDVSNTILAREQRVLSGDLNLLRSSIASLAAQRAQKEAERARLSSTIASQQELLKIEEQRVDLRKYLEASQLGSKLPLFDAQEALQTQKTSLAQMSGQLAEAEAALDTIDRDLSKTISSFIAENSQKLADAERQAAETAQNLAKAQAKLAHMTLRAPVSEVVQALSVTSIRQVLMPGEETMRIVPDDNGVEIECYVSNKDIGFIKDGQEAVIKVEAFPFTRYGTLSARVKSVSSEAIADVDVQQRENDPARSARSALPAGAQHVQNLVFPVTLSLEDSSISADGAKIAVSNGMAVSVEIKTGYRKIIDYLFSPLVDVSSTALRER